MYILTLISNAGPIASEFSHNWCDAVRDGMALAQHHGLRVNVYPVGSDLHCHTFYPPLDPYPEC
mgnify:CR=1 FL=1